MLILNLSWRFHWILSHSLWSPPTDFDNKHKIKCYEFFELNFNDKTESEESYEGVKNVNLKVALFSVSSEGKLTWVKL